MSHGPCREACDPDAYELVFNEQEALRDLETWRRSGPAPATRVLIDALRAEGIDGARIIDVGAGVGVLHLELLAAGAAHAIDVDLSRAYLGVAREEAERRDLGERVEHRHGDFAAVADELPDADAVTMDRVICCYADVTALLDAATRRATQLIGLVYPSDIWLVRAGISIQNLIERLLRRGGCAFHVHRRAAVERQLSAGGFRLARSGGSWFWRVAVYRRA